MKADSNQSSITYFTIAGISGSSAFQAPIFALALLVYVFVFAGNVTIALLVFLDAHLRSPMYSFLCSLSLLDICYVTVALHKVLDTFVSGDNSVSLPVCLTQMYFYMAFGGSELMLLTAMSYDRYLAVCLPLHYRMIMHPHLCAFLITLSWFLGLAQALPFLFLALRITCFISKEINHFFCEMLAFMKLSCSGTSFLELIIHVESIFTGFAPFILTFLSYMFIVRSILRIRSTSGRFKAFYTCSSHLTVVILFYLTLFCLYLRPVSASSLEGDKLSSLLYTVVVPVLNPLIYSLRNKDVKTAWKRTFKWVQLVC
ncbi:olfactory receptor 150-like [Spea bombifrons]|uniref:olfactory receptor 150-like n=1 Tax=Spea bombifrons TaxID=233779 RepID=UPI00234AF1FF|nr:olfactory receptor 150-like [Spea bombifrons]